MLLKLRCLAQPLKFEALIFPMLLINGTGKYEWARAMTRSALQNYIDAESCLP